MKTITIIFALLSYTCHCQNNWVSIELTGMVTVEFPAIPEAINSTLNRIVDSTGYYMTLHSEHSGIGDFQSNKKDLNTYYTSFVKKFIDNSGGLLINKSSFKVNGYKGVEFIIDLIGPDSQNFRFISRAFLVEETMYSIICYTLPEHWKSDSTRRKRFLNSVKLSSRR
ncbi:MAG: hypothetical protein ACI837_000818 [Crocinitomicaceae bacterium]|jgi:hypothetical protein